MQNTLTNRLKSLLLILIVLTFNSCFKIPKPVFTYTPRNPKVGQEIQFINSSKNVKVYKWDFGNGTTSEEKNPKVVYTKSDVYEVVLYGYTGIRSSQERCWIAVEP